MKHTKMKPLCITAAFVLSAGCFPDTTELFAGSRLTAYAEETSGSCGYEGDNVLWVLKDGVLTVSGTGQMQNYYRDMTRSPWYDNRNDIQSVIIKDGVTNIGGSAFFGCSNMKEVSIPDSVERIETFAFSGCSGLTEVTIPDSVHEIYEFVFENCTGLTAVALPDNLESLPHGVLSGCTGLTDITIPDNVSIIMQDAFSQCTGLTKLTIPEKVYSFSGGACNGCSSLTDIDVSDDNEKYCSLNGIVFTKDQSTIVSYPGGKKDTEYTIPDSVTSIGNFAFAYCSNLKSVIIPESVTSIANYGFFVCKALTEISIPDSVTSIGRSAFSSCSSLISVKLPNGVTCIEESTFSSCINLKEISVPDGLTSIGSSAFWYCKNLTSFAVPDSVTSIGNSAFLGCSELNEITIPDGVTSIESGLFSSCSNLSEINIPDSVSSIRSSAFENCTNLNAIKIPDGVTGIGESTFSGCESLTEISIPESVTSISDMAFNRCKGLTEITIPESVTSIGRMAFYECENLNQVTILNPECIITDQASTFCTNLSKTYPVTYIYDGVIRGYTDSTAQIYANRFDRKFRSLDNDEPETTESTAETTTAADTTERNESSTSFETSESASTETTLASETTTSIETSTTSDTTIYFDTTTVEEATTGMETTSTAETTTSMESSSAKDTTSSTENTTAPNETTASVFNGLKYFVQNEEVIVSGFTDELPAVLVIPAEIEGKPVTGFTQFALAQCNKLKEVTLPDTVISFGMQTFWGCKNLEKVTLPSTLKSVYEAAFAQCTSLKSVTIPDGCETIGNLVFSGCTALTEVHIPASVTEFGEPAFIGTPWLEEKRKENPLVIENGILIDGMTESGDITIPDGVRTIAAYAFSWEESTAVKDVTAVTIPESVTVIGMAAFNGCEKLETVELPDAPIRIGAGAFGGTPWFEKLQEQDPLVIAAYDVLSALGTTGTETVPDGVKYISPWAFSRNEDVTEVTLPESVAEIGRGAFSECTALTSLTVRNPDCVFLGADMTVFSGYDENWEPVFNGVIFGYDNSTAEKYAKENGCQFESLGEAPAAVSDWNEKYVISRNTAEAELVVRVGDIDACNDEEAVAENGYDPFTAKSQYAHSYPWPEDDTDPAGTDRIFVGSKWKGECADGYSSNYANYKNGDDKENAYGDGALSFTMEYDASGIEIKNVILQLCIDDFQAVSWDSVFTVTLNGKDAPFIAELLNHTDQTGPTAYIVSAMIPSGFFSDIASGKLTVVIDETTGAGDGYAIDFAKLLINYDDQIFTGTFSGKTKPGATVRLLGTSTTVTASSTGEFAFSAIPGINAVRASKNGFIENYDSGIVLSAGTEWKPEITLEKGQGNPDIDFSKFVETGMLIKGDYNADGEVSDADAVLLARFIGEDTTLTDEEIDKILIADPDLNEDGHVTLLDVTALLKVISGK